MIVGVPDSKLADWLKDRDYIIATDEGEAIAIAAGCYLATGEPATVFMQSDGYSNALNAITTLMMPYNIPFELKLSVRADEPQHEIMGKKIHKIIELIREILFLFLGLAYMECCQKFRIQYNIFRRFSTRSGN